MLDLVGRQTMTIDKGSAGTLVLDNTPVYIVGIARRVMAVEPGKLLADSVEDYSDQQGEAGWSYGFDDGRGAGDGLNSAAYAADEFKQMVPATDAWRGKWGQPRYPWLAIGLRDAHPSRSAERPIWAIRRWTSSASGPVRISGHIIHAAQQGDGVTAHIAVDGRLVLSANLGGAWGTQEIEYDVKANLRSGSRVDFIVTPGLHGDINFDSTTFEARIIGDAP